MIKLFKYLDKKNDQLFEFRKKKWYNGVIVMVISLIVFFAPMVLMPMLYSIIWALLWLIFIFAFLTWVFHRDVLN